MDALGPITFDELRVEVRIIKAAVVKGAAEGLRFHDLRHAYATWLISDGLPVNVVQRVMGHASVSTTLNLFVHPSSDHDDAVRAILG